MSCRARLQFILITMKKYNSQQPQSSEAHKQEQSEKQEEQPNLNAALPQNMEYFQILLQNYLQNVQNIPPLNSNNIMNIPPSPLYPRNNAYLDQICSNGMINSVVGIVQQQTQSLEELNTKVELVVAQNKELHRRIKELEAQNQILKSKEGKRENEMSWKQPINQIKVEGESVTRQNLLDILFGKQKYQYKLVLAQPLDQPLYRERNFNIIMQLVDNNNNRVPNSNKIPMSLALYTCENPPKFIEKNTAGQKMLKGYVDQSLVLGTCHFQKVQIREVTSHYRSGWIFLVAIPCMTPLGTNKTQNFVDFTKIKPLVIDEVVVKAKKPKKKDEKKEESEQLGQ